MPPLLSTYRAKLFAAFMVVLGSTLLLAAVLGGAWVREAAIHEVRVRLREAAEGLRADVVQEEGRLLRAARAAAADTAFSRSAAGGRSPELIAALVRMVSLGGFDVVECGDARGRVIARGHNPSAWGEDKSDQRIVAAALSGRSAADIERGASGIAVRVVVPVPPPRGGGRPVGTLMIGDSIDTDFVGRYARITGVEIALFEGDSLVTATDTAFAAAGVAGPAGFDVEAVPLLRGDGAPFGSIAAGRARAEVERYVAGTTRALGVGLAAGVLIAAAVSTVLVRRFSRPIESLHAAMQALEDGRPAVEVAVDTDDEFGALERGFNRMAAKIRESYRRLERMRRERVRGAQRSLADRLVAEVAHEIRNPLNAMAAQVELLHAAPVPGRPEDARRVEILAEEIRRLDRTVESLAAAAGPLRLDLAPVDIAGRLDALLDLVAEEAARRGVRIDRRYAPAAPLRLDGCRLHQALLNVVLNALQSMPEGGRLDVEVVEAPDHARISIADTGRGMTPEEEERVFETYYSTRQDGTGLGLPIALRIVEAHGGRIEIESRPGEGTRVDVHLPRGEDR